MKWVRDMVVNGTRGEQHPDGDHERGQLAVRAMVEWRAKNYTDAEIKFAFQKAVRRGVVRQPGFFEFVKSVLVGESERLAEIPTASPKAAPSPVQYYRADPTRPDPTKPRPAIKLDPRS